MIALKRSRNYDEDMPLTWRNYVFQGKVIECSPVMVDPNNHYLSLSRHIVDPDGTVHGPPGQSGSVKCPICGWDDTVRLEGWKGL